MENTQILHFLRFTIVFLCCVLAFCIRLFSNVMNEPIIHEFDPHFNWRCTQFIDQHGLYEFLGWFDNISWYPQGRPVGETAYPGLMYTSAIIKWSLQKVHICVDLLDICVYTGPIFAVLSTLLAFLYGQLIEDSSLGCVFAALTSFIAGMISRSMAGSYDYECISLFILVACIYTFSLALKTGSIFFATISGLFYGYMSLTWGGYVFIANCIPLYVAGLVALGHYSWRLHITYSIWAIIGSLINASIPFISDKLVKKPEHFAMIGVFVVLNGWGLFTYLRSILSPPSYSTVIVSSILSLPVILFLTITVGVSTGLLGGFSGRLLQMFDPSYATKNIPIIASVAEHQPSSWGMYFMDCGYLLILFPLGCYFILRDGISNNTELQILLLIYGLSTLYFASIMVRLVLVFTPAMVLVAGVGLQRMLRISFRSKSSVSHIIICTIFSICVFSEYHSVWFAALSYSGDHIHFPVRTANGQEMSDDYREAYRWLWTNSGRDERVMSWWDYGYQITSMGGRGCMADGNTNNFTHIGIIGMSMSSPEPISWRLARLMGADYMLVIFGGACGYDGDDINKFLWMPKIANQTFTNISGDMYMSSPYESIVGPNMRINMTNSMMFRFCYNNFKRYQFHPSLPQGMDLMRYTQVPNLDIKLTHFQEAFTSKHWIVRIYKVNPDPLWDRVY
ncbi:Oligosaccharyl transferase STT3 subunit family protein [Tritrichomonas foetus]|uniref:dolichyl-diphosphooligosaccharide--protein glycotransferase n=1 Tax=Tritrichomonas foetus TaxID=1144522 RepID=A0A1J4KFF2_9EUKA|nr:Oligosaccharyl transferase STT3 subunit family protein [Tritrichomonas foetus]|eukprot:OHT08326.1 Oligosaccharyl transferase STT3 subunit family protein [Tritrichomonas foetus]